MAHTYRPPTAGHQRSPSMIKFAELNQTFRKAGPGPIVAQHPPQPTAHQIQMEARRHERAKQASHIPTDKEIPDGVEDLVIGDGVQCYKQLRDVEKRLDAIMMRRRLDQMDRNGSIQRKHQTMRIWISNTADNQPWQQTSMDHEAFDFGDTSSQATYRVKIEGRLLPDDNEEPSEKGTETTDAMDEDTSKPTGRSPVFDQKTRFSHFFKQITIDFDRSSSLQPDQIAQIEWKKPVQQPVKGAPNAAGVAAADMSDQANFDCIEFERKGDENINITINLVRDENPDRFKLSPALADLLGVEEDDRAGVVMGIWSYVRARKLQRDDEMRIAQCDAKLRGVFGVEKFHLAHVPEHILPHLTPLPPITLPYTIRVDSSYLSHPTPTIYDVTVTSTITPPSALLPSGSTTLAQLDQLAQKDAEIATAVQAMQRSKAKHAFLTSMSRDPVAFIKRWMASQRRDMEVILGEASRGQDEHGVGEEWRKGGKESVWGSDVARESVALFLARQRMHP